VIFAGNLQVDRFVTKTHQFMLVAQHWELETQIWFLGYSSDREEKAWLSSVIILESHVRVAVWTDYGLEIIIFLFVFFWFLNLRFWP
jgi:hypothetical protein